MLNVTINNLPTTATKYTWITAREVDGELWFFGAWNDEEKAVRQAQEIGGIALKVGE